LTLLKINSTLSQNEVATLVNMPAIRHAAAALQFILLATGYIRGFTFLCHS
jgi:hypothetical protein